MQAQRLFERWGMRLPLLVVTGEIDLQALDHSGMVYLPKPVQPARLARWLLNVRSGADTRADALVLQQAPPHPGMQEQP